MSGSVIELQNVRKAFVAPGGEIVPVLDIESFALGAGEECALEGQSGSGKSTLLNVISGIMRPDTGSVLVGGHDIARFDEARRDRVRADTLGLVFQQFNLLPGFTALENVLVAMSFGSRRPDRNRAAGLLAAVGLSHRLDHKPAELSVGQQQRVAVARALANRPRAVLADEPTASIDTAHQEQVIELLRGACRDEHAALLVVTHDPAVAGRFPRRLRLEDFNRAARIPAAPERPA
ncbi:MAG: ABC transporter ATP-binding protein [Planctomycetia bacterium]|nr:ABC transporter ATP-binding protein [Planctomycetia bacterium]